MNRDDLKEFEKENLDAMEKLFAEKESIDEQDQNRYRYYQDAYNNEYRWTTHKQDDDKFHATFLKYSHHKGWGKLKVKKVRLFVKRSSAKRWCLKRMLKAKEHQVEVIKRRFERKQARLDAKPKLTPTQKAIKIAESKIQHYTNLQMKCDKKIRSLHTRNKTYQKRINYNKKRIEKLGLQDQNLERTSEIRL